MAKEWKIDTWWQKLLLIAAMIQGALSIVAFIIGFILGLLGL